MVTAARAKELLSRHGRVRPQPASDWKGAFALPTCVEQFYKEVGPIDLLIEAHGNPFSLPRLASLWKFQTGYRWNGLRREPITGWDDDWLVIADEGGDPFILSRSTGVALFALHGADCWSPTVLFPDLNSMADCLGYLGLIAGEARDVFLDDNGNIRPESRERARAGLRELLGTVEGADLVLDRLGWS